MFEVVKYKYNEFEKKDKRYNELMYFIKRKLSEENREIVSGLDNPKVIWETI